MPFDARGTFRRADSVQSDQAIAEMLALEGRLLDALDVIYRVPTNTASLGRLRFVMDVLIWRVMENLRGTPGGIAQQMIESHLREAREILASVIDDLAGWADLQYVDEAALQCAIQARPIVGKLLRLAASLS